MAIKNIAHLADKETGETRVILDWTDDGCSKWEGGKWWSWWGDKGWVEADDEHSRICEQQLWERGVSMMRTNLGPKRNAKEGK